MAAGVGLVAGWAIGDLTRRYRQAFSSSMLCAAGCPSPTLPCSSGSASSGKSAAS